MDDALLRRYARLIVEVGANIQPGQNVWIVARAERGAARPRGRRRGLRARRAVRRPVVLRPAREADPRSSGPPRTRSSSCRPGTAGGCSSSARRTASRISITPQRAARAAGRHRPGARRPRRAAGARRELRRDQREDDELDASSRGRRPNGRGSSTRRSTTRRRWRSSGSSSSTCCGSTSPTRRPRGTTALAQLHEAGTQARRASVRRAPLRRARHRSDGRAAPDLAVRLRDARHADGRRDRPRAEPADRGDLRRRPTRRAPTASSRRRSRSTSAAP